MLLSSTEKNRIQEAFPKGNPLHQCRIRVRSKIRKKPLQVSELVQLRQKLLWGSMLDIFNCRSADRKVFIWDFAWTEAHAFTQHIRAEEWCELNSISTRALMSWTFGFWFEVPFVSWSLESRLREFVGAACFFVCLRTINTLVPYCKLWINLIIIIHHKLAKGLAAFLTITKQGVVVFVLDLPKQALGKTEQCVWKSIPADDSDESKVHFKPI